MHPRKLAFPTYRIFGTFCPTLVVDNPEADYVFEELGILGHYVFAPLKI
jgi:hypothetical protein